MKKIFLTYYQAIIFVHKLAEMKEENPYFNNEIANAFKKYMFQRSEELSSFTNNPLKRLMPGYDKFIITENMFNYLKNITGVDPFNKEIMEEYLPLITPVLNRATEKLDIIVSGFNYEKVDPNNEEHVEALRRLLEDSEYKKYFNLIQMDFDSYLESLRKSQRIIPSQYFVKSKNKYIGWINSTLYNEDGKNKSLLDIFMFPEFRGKHLSKEIIVDYINYAQLDEILIEVNSGNIISQKLAMSLGFEPYKIDNEDGIIKYKLDCSHFKSIPQKLE